MQDRSGEWSASILKMAGFLRKQPYHYCIAENEIKYSFYRLFGIQKTPDTAPVSGVFLYLKL